MALPQKSNLIAHWKMNDNAANTTVVDNIAGYNGTAARNTSAFTAVGRINSSLDFNGSSDQVLVADNSVFSFTTGSNDLPFSISCWIYLDALSGYYSLLSKASSASTAEWEIGVSSVGYGLAITLWDPAIANKYNVGYTAVGVTPTSQWNHIVAAYDGSGSTTSGMSIYVNGDSLALTRTTYGTTYVCMRNSNSTVSIGYRVLNGPSRMNGRMDDIRIYNNFLTQSQVWSLYNNGNGTENEYPTGPFPTFFRT